MTEPFSWPSSSLAQADVTLRMFDSGGDRPPVLMLHGLGGYAMEWQAVASLLRSRHRLIAFDQRGHGASTRWPTDVGRQAHVRDAVPAMDELRLDRVTLVGQSMGAHTAMMVAGAHPHRVSRLVLVEGGPAAAGPQATQDVIDWFRSWPTPFKDASATLQYFEGQYGPGRAAKTWAAGLEHCATGYQPRFDVDVLRRAIEEVHMFDQWRVWDNLSCPVTVVRGNQGFLSRDEAQQMISRNSHAHLVTVPGAGHDVHLDRPGAVADAV